jgi:hypothetical protein
MNPRLLTYINNIRKYYHSYPKFGKKEPLVAFVTAEMEKAHRRKLTTSPWIKVNHCNFHEGDENFEYQGALCVEIYFVVKDGDNRNLYSIDLSPCEFRIKETFHANGV